MKTGQLCDNRKGQALLVTLLLVLILAILTGGLAAMWQSEVQIRAFEKNNLIAFYLAQAGLERAKIEAQYSITPSASEITLAGGTYSRTIVSPMDANQKVLTGIGRVYDTASNIVAERRISVTVHGISIPPISQNALTWKEQ
jgi:Tfp pilus assembly protein PilX